MGKFELRQSPIINHGKVDPNPLTQPTHWDVVEVRSIFGVVWKRTVVARFHGTVIPQHIARTL